MAGRVNLFPSRPPDMSPGSLISQSSARLLACLLFGISPVCAQQEGSAPLKPLEIEVLSVDVNDSTLPPEIWRKTPATVPLTVPSVRSLRVRFQERFPDALPSRKLRYFLSGQDTEWHTLRAHAQLTVRFLDDAGAIIGTEDFNAEGESPGWLGNVTASEFIPRSAQLTAPARSKRIQLTLISSVPEMLGQYAVCDISLTVSPPGEAPASPVSISTDEGVEMANPLGSPLQWARSGTRAQLAHVVALLDGKHALALVDNESRTFGAWILKPAFCPEVREGHRIALHWRECFSLGRGREGSAVYENLPAGNYKLLVAARDPDGRDTPGSPVLAFRVPVPFWERPPFWILVCVGAAGSVFGLTRVAARRRLERYRAETERLHVLEKERSRIARDIHDELGASLAAIALMSGRTRDRLSEHSEAASQLEEISQRATKTARQLAGIVWAVNPTRCQFAQKHLELAKVLFRTEIPAELPALALSASARHAVFLAAKERTGLRVLPGSPRKCRAPSF